MTTAQRVIEKLKAGPATLRDLALEGVSASTLERTVLRMSKRGEIQVVGTKPRPPGKRGSSPYLWAVKS